MVDSVVIICEDSPFGKNSVVESIRMAAGLLALDDLESVKVILMGDAVYFLNKDLNPKTINVGEFTNIFRLVDLSGLEIYIHDESLKEAGIDPSNLVLIDNVDVVDISKISEAISNANMTFKY